MGQKSKNELTRLHVGQKHPFTQKIRSLAQKRSILTQNGVCQNRCAYDCTPKGYHGHQKIWKDQQNFMSWVLCGILKAGGKYF